MIIIIIIITNTYDRFKLLEEKLKDLEEKQGTNPVSATLSSVRNAL